MRAVGLLCFRLRDLTAQDKLEHQRVVKDLEKAHSDLKTALETRDKMQAELKVSAVCVCVEREGFLTLGGNAVP